VWVTARASSIYFTTRDTARLRRGALLGGGANEYGSVLEPATLTIFEPHYQPDPRVPGIVRSRLMIGAGAQVLVRGGLPQAAGAEPGAEVFTEASPIDLDESEDPSSSLGS
jgi:hypothetical protein